VTAENVTFFSDTLSTSAPGENANHTFSFTLTEAIAPGGQLTFTWPSDFTVSSSTTTFAERNVELIVNGTARTATTTASAVADGVSITRGAGGSITYTLNSTAGLQVGEELEFRVGNHTSGSLGERQVVLGTSSTTTMPADIAPVVNSNATGTHEIAFSATGGGRPIGADFVIFLSDPIGVGPVDTTEEIPPFRFNGAPTGTISGTTLSIELSLETNEFASCRYATTASTSYATMPNSFDSSGLIIHTRIISVTPDTSYTFYVRCIDDEGNFNTDDYLISFDVGPAPTGSVNTDAEDGGDGTGTADSGTGGGPNDGSETNSDDPANGPQTSGGGGGGSGGGGGGGGGGGTGGGFENEGPYESGDGRVNIAGVAWPRADIVVLVDGQVAEDGSADSDGRFTIQLDEIARGAYTFGVYAIDDNNVRSDTYSTSFTVSGARAVTLSDIDLIGTIRVDPDPVDLNTVASIEGYTIPDSQVTIEVRPQGGSAQTLLATSAGNGAYSTSLSTAGLSRGTYEVRFRAEPSAGDPSPFSKWNVFGVGEEAAVTSNTDLNRDGFVNLIDFSILLFWWGGDGGDSDPPADINQDGSVSLTDFSILLFDWTG
jgi:hypothetical protein